MKFPKGVVKAKRPKMANHRGRTWDTCNVVLPDGTTAKGYLDTTWGTRVYFAHSGDWRAIPLHMYERADTGMTLTCDLRIQDDGDKHG